MSQDSLLIKEATKSFWLRILARQTVVNPGFEKPGRAKSYLATQEFIVPKEAIYSLIAKVMAEKWCDRASESAVTILEPGCGPGLLLANLIEAGVLDRFDCVRLFGADISEQMILEAAKQIDWINFLSKRSSNEQRSECILTGGANCLDTTDVFYRNVSEGSISLFAMSQFLHYFPNTRKSVLGVSLDRTGVPYRTKREFLHYVWQSLERGGLLFIIDDYLISDPVIYESQLRRWDEFVLNNFSNIQKWEAISRIDPTTAAEIARRYDRTRTREELLMIARKSRERRRAECREELWTIDENEGALREIFGTNRVGKAQHPLRESHGHFFLLWAQK